MRPVEKKELKSNIIFQKTLQQNNFEINQEKHGFSGFPGNFEKIDPIFLYRNQILQNIIKKILQKYYKIFL